MTRARLLLFCSGALSVALALAHFATRSALQGNDALRASHDLVGLSMLYAGLVTVSVAWLVLGRQLVAGYATLYGVYLAGHTWILLWAGFDYWLRAGAALLMAVAAFAAAIMAWTDKGRSEGDGGEE